VVEVPIYDGRNGIVATLMVLVSVRTVGALVDDPSGDILCHMSLSQSYSNEETGRKRTNLSKAPFQSSVGGLPDLLGLTATQSTSVLDVTTEMVGDLDQNQEYRLGDLLTPSWLETHAAQRVTDAKMLCERARFYHEPCVSTETLNLTPDKRRSPASYRPSSSKMEPFLSGIPFNVHVQSITLERPDGAAIGPTAFRNVTCGAPCDHARGFRGPSSSAGGGLRRFEAARDNLIGVVNTAHCALHTSVAEYFVANPNRTHISSSNGHLQLLRGSLVQHEQRLAELTWECAMRRASTFSQALAIGITSYLSSLSNLELTGIRRIQWVTQGYLICFEGLLSAAGKEQHMIEDAAIAIDMLRMVQVQLVRNEPGGQPGHEPMKAQEVFPVHGSRVIRWISLVQNKLSVSVPNRNVKFTLKVALDGQYFDARLPPELLGGVAVPFYPILFQMGVDIRQWGANTLNVKNQIDQSRKGKVPESLPVDDDEDTIGATDNDLLIQLNYEAFRRLNMYANAADPISHPDEQMGGSIAIHPMLGPLWNFVKGSAGKMEHGIIDRAAAAARDLGGGGVIFCKSGKDRTAMQVTLKQSQYLITAGLSREKSNIFSNATMMRANGTRLAICEKNVGQAKYAFNSLQARFMPNLLKPPKESIAGFLKGGRVFSGEGAIET